MTTFVLAVVDEKEFVGCKKKRIRNCVRCDEKERMSEQTFLCESCFRSQARRLRRLYGRRKKRQKRESSPEYLKWMQIAKENGIRSNTYHSRVYNTGMTYEQAATTPLIRNPKNYRKAGVKSE